MRGQVSLPLLGYYHQFSEGLRGNGRQILLFLIVDSACPGQRAILSPSYPIRQDANFKQFLTSQNAGVSMRSMVPLDSEEQAGNAGFPRLMRVRMASNSSNCNRCRGPASNTTSTPIHVSQNCEFLQIRAFD
jgi:hypothetical protein